MTIKRRLKGMLLRRLHNMISCVEFEGFINSCLDEALPGKQRKLFEWHLQICRECREYMAAYKRTIELSQATLGGANDAVPEDVPEDLIRAILDTIKT
jgi:hypothetical protein